MPTVVRRARVDRTHLLSPLGAPQPLLGGEDVLFQSVQQGQVQQGQVQQGQVQRPLFGKRGGRQELTGSEPDHVEYLERGPAQYKLSILSITENTTSPLCLSDVGRLNSDIVS